MLTLEERIKNIMEKGGSRKAVAGIINMGLKTPVTRRALINAIEKATYKMAFKGPDRPRKVMEERYYMGSALLSSLQKAFDSGSISKNCVKALSNIFLGKIFIEGIYVRRTFEEKHGFRPPCFVTISPTNVCNLKCKGC